MDETAVRRISLHDLFDALIKGISRHCPDVDPDAARMQSSTQYFRHMLELAASTGEPELVSVVRELRSRGVMLAPLVSNAPLDAAHTWSNPDIEQTRASARRIHPADPVWEQPVPAPIRISWRSIGIALGLSIIASLGVWWWFQHAVNTVSGDVRGNIRWSNDQHWRLEGIVHVLPGAKLTIDPGTTVLGAPGSALIVTRGATIDARGTMERPIVFTSAQPEGQRSRGDWGGLVLMGSAPVNQRATHLEGIPEGDTRGHFGGRNTEGGCGALSYVRIEFAGRETYPDRELNGLTLAGCGSSTVIDHIQVHKPLDDGIEIFGGSVSLRNVVITDPGDDGLDYDLGWRGRIQYLAVKMFPGYGDNAIEGDNNARFPVMTPASSPTIFNAALIGSGMPQERHRAMNLRSGTEGQFGNVLIAGFHTRPIVLQGAETFDNAIDGRLFFSSSGIFRAGISPHEAVELRHEPAALFPGTQTQSSKTSISSVSLSDAVKTRKAHEAPDEAIRQALLGDGKLVLGDEAFNSAAYSTLRPAFLASNMMLDGSELPSDEFWDKRGHFVGVAEKGEAAPWWSGWTAFPAN
jgi:hypothetical protein